ncbi:WD40 repeat-like protein [Martensiomyces pterosporus]|nr:WD40 repeat-like protein [Martensiomyces pterosporus]
MADYVLSAKAGIESTAYIDDLIREYLLFRGFKQTLKAFEEDLERDQDKGFKAEQIAGELLGMAKDLKVEELLEYWRYLTFRFFSHLSPKYHRTTRMFEKRLIRLFLVSAVQAGRRQRIRVFMDKHGHSLGHQGGDWIPWLGLEYVDDPKTRPEFEAYFSDDWYVSLKTALTDFIQTVFPAMAVPRILLYDKDRREREALKAKVRQYEERLSGETKIKTIGLSGEPSGLVENHIEQVASAKSAGKQPLVSEPANHGSSSASSADREIGVIKTNEPSSMLKVSQEDIFLEHNSGISLARFSLSGELIASYDDESILKVWSPDPASTAPKLKNELDYTVNAMAWDKKHAHLLYLYDEDGYIHTMNTNTNLMSRQLVFEKRHPWIQNMLCSPVSSSLLTISSTKPESTTDISLRIWDANANKTMVSKRMAAAPESQGVCASFNHNGNLLALAYNTGHIRLLDTRSFETVASIATKQKAICAAEFSFDEDSLMIVSEVGKLTQWSLRKDSQMVAESHLNLGSSNGGAVPADSRLDCDRIAFTPDRENVLVAPNDQCLVFNIDSAALTDTMRRHKDLITCIDFAADRSLSASDDGTIRVARYRKV